MSEGQAGTETRRLPVAFVRYTGGEPVEPGQWAPIYEDLPRYRALDNWEVVEVVEASDLKGTAREKAIRPELDTQDDDDVWRRVENVRRALAGRGVRLHDSAVKAIVEAACDPALRPVVPALAASGGTRPAFFTDEEIERCCVCGRPLVTGQEVISDGQGLRHAACVPEARVKGNSGEPSDEDVEKGARAAWSAVGPPYEWERVSNKDHWLDLSRAVLSAVAGEGTQ